MYFTEDHRIHIHQEVVEIWVHSAAKSVQLLTCDSMNNKLCKLVSFTKHVSGGSKFVSLKGSTKAIQYYLTGVTNKAEIFIAKNNNRNKNHHEIQLPLALSKTEKLSLPLPRFFIEISLHGLTSTWKCYNLHVTSDSECNVRRNDQCIVLEVENESTGELYVSQPEPKRFQNNSVDMKLKFFTPSPANESLKLRIWSKSMFSNLQIDIQADLKCALGQIIRFNPDLLIRYTLVLNLVNREVTKFASGFAILFITFRTTLNCFVADATTKNSQSWFDAFTDSIVVESCVIGLAMSIAQLFEFVIHVLLYLVQKILFVQYISRQFSSTNSAVVKYVFCSIFIVYLGYIYKTIGPHVVILSCLIVHLFRDISHESITFVGDDYGSSITFLPITLFSVMVPVVLTLKSFINNGNIFNDVVNSSFTNSNVVHLALCYALYLMLSLVAGRGRGRGTDHLSGLRQFSGGVKRTLIVVICLVFMLGEVFNLYNLSYLVVARMMIGVCFFLKF